MGAERTKKIVQPENIAAGADNPLKRGMEALARGDTAGALSYFEAAAAATPGDPVPNVRAGNVLRDLERFEEAEAKYRAVLAQAPDNAGALLGLAHIARKKDDPDSALRYLEAAQKAEPSNPKVFMQLGNLHRNASRWPEAQTAYEAVLKLDESNANALAFLGQIAQARGEKVEAIDFLRRAVAIDPSLPRAPSLLSRLVRETEQKDATQKRPGRRAAPGEGKLAKLPEAIRVARGKGNDDAACEYLETAAQADPGNVEILLELAATQRRLNRLEDAAETYEGIIAKDSKNTKAHLGLAHIARNHRNPDAALEHFKAAGELDPGNLQTQMHVADVFARQGRHAEADAICEAVLAKSDNNPQIFVSLGAVARNTGNWDAARRYFAAAVAADPSKPQFRIQLGRAYCDLLMPDEAERCFSEVREGEPNNAEAIIGLGEVARLRKDTGAALKFFEQAAKIAPNNARVRAVLRKLKTADGSFDWHSEIEGAIAIVRAPDAPAGAQLTAATLLVEHGMTEAVAPVLAKLQTQSPAARQLALAVREIERMGLAQPLSADGAALDAADSQLESLQGFHEKPVAGSDTLLLVFAGRNDRVWMTFSLLHRILRKAGVSIVYARDLRQTWYTTGVEGLGDDYDSAVEGFKSLAARYGARRILTLGNCVGCLGALRFGLSLGAQGVLGIAPNVRPIGNLKPEFAARVEALRRLLPAGHKDMHARYAEAVARPDVTLVYGEQSEPDASDAKYMTDIPGVRIAGIPNATDHDSVKDLLIRGLLEPILREFATSGSVSAELLSKIATSGNP